MATTGILGRVPSVVTAVWAEAHPSETQLWENIFADEMNNKTNKKVKIFFIKFLFECYKYSCRKTTSVFQE